MYDANQPKAVSWEDLRCGSTIMVWGRSLLLLSCDRTTELFYQRKGIAQNPMQVEEDKGPAFPGPCRTTVSGRKTTYTVWVILTTEDRQEHDRRVPLPDG